jgi:apolipoprotein D and lipocalin family protein
MLPVVIANHVLPVLAALGIVLTAASLTPLAGGAVSSEVRTVPHVDLDRYAGEWFEIARFPNRFQDECAGDVRAMYERRSDGRIDVTNSCRRADGSVQKANGVAKIVDPSTGARLKVRFAPALVSFLPFVWGDYWIVGLSEDYSWATVGSPDRKYLWILARQPRLDASAFDAARAAAQNNGFEVDSLVETRHTAPGETGW